MTPVHFPEANANYGPPEGMAETQVMRIPAWRGGLEGGDLDGAPAIVTAWKPTSADLQILNAGGFIYVQLLTAELPPHGVSVVFPYTLKKED